MPDIPSEKFTRFNRAPHNGVRIIILSSIQTAAALAETTYPGQIYFMSNLVQDPLPEILSNIRAEAEFVRFLRGRPAAYSIGGKDKLQPWRGKSPQWPVQNSVLSRLLACEKNAYTETVARSPQHSDLHWEIIELVEASGKML